MNGMSLFDDGNAHGQTKLAMNDSPPLRYCVCNDGKTYLRVADLWSAMFPGEKISQEAIDLLISRDSNHDLGMLLRKKEKFPGCGPEEDVVSFAGAHVWLWTLASHERSPASKEQCKAIFKVMDCLNTVAKIIPPSGTANKTYPAQETQALENSLKGRTATEKMDAVRSLCALLDDESKYELARDLHRQAPLSKPATTAATSAGSTSLESFEKRFQL